MDARTRRDGKELETLGSYDPLVTAREKQVALKRDRIEHWLGAGALPTDTVAGILKRAGIKKPQAS